MSENVTLEQEVASIMAFAHSSAGKPAPYYYDVPEQFRTPAIFFPEPEISTRGETFFTYASEYAWYINIFGATSAEAHAIGLRVLTALKRAKNLVPIIAEDGKETGEKLRLKDPQLRNIEAGVVQLSIEWTSRRPYDATIPPRMQRFKLGYEIKEASEHGKKGQQARRGPGQRGR